MKDMSKGFQPAITIKEAIDNIDDSTFLLPAIQRKFIWSTEQIELLFDSIMREYPINSLMLWRITSERIEKNYKFYSFLRTYIQRHGEMNEVLNTNGIKDFSAVIDGQQRLNSLYIGLKGTYATKLPNKYWTYSKDNFPPKKLYLNIKSENSSDSEIDKKYEFSFLTKNKVEKENLEGEKYWFEVGDILNMKSPRDQYKFLDGIGLGDNDFSGSTLDKLSIVINTEKTINYYIEDEQNPDKVLDIFIRTNDGGTKLSFSDLLMSVLTANWSDARERFDDLAKEVNQFGEFVITSDFILKTMLYLYSEDIKNRVKNFDNNVIESIISNWDRLRKSILNCFEMFHRLGFSNRTFPAKNAAIPIIAWVYNNNREDEISKKKFFDATETDSNKMMIKKWLILAFLKRIFGGQSDTILLEMRRLINSNGNNNFPLSLIVESAKGNPTKNYSFDEEIINGIFESTCGSEDASFVLSLFYPDLDYFNQNFHIDHTHPKTYFLDNNKLQIIFNEEQISNISDKWNKVANLQLINNEMNNTKLDKELVDWMKEKDLPNSFLFVDDTVSLDLKDFEKYYDNRLANMKKRLKEIIA